MENKTNTQLQPMPDEQVPQGLANKLNKTSVKSPGKFPVKIVIIFLIVLLFIGLGFGGFWWYSKGQILKLAKEMKWGWGTELTKYNIKTDFTFGAKNFVSEEQIPGFSLDKGLVLTANVDYSAVDDDIDNNISLNIAGALDANVLLGIKKINNNIYIKPEFDIDNPIINSFLDKLYLEEGQYIKIDSDNTDPFNPEAIVNLNLQQYLEKNSVFNQKISDIIPRLIEEKILNIENPNNNIDTEDGKLKEIQFSIKQDRFKDFYFIIGESFDKTREELLEEFEKENNAEIKKIFEDFVNTLKLSVFVNTRTKYIQGIGFNLKDFHVEKEGLSFDISLSTNTLLQTTELSDIEIPQNVVKYKEVFEERPKIEGVKIVFKESLEPILNCLMEEKEINRPNQKLYLYNVEDVAPSFICEGSSVVWPTLPPGYDYADYYSFNVSENSYSWEYCAHHNELDDIQCKEEGCLGEDCFQVLEDSCKKVEECNIIIDTDNDGLSDEDEIIYGTDINNPDTDGDGYLDGEEVESGYNPLGEGLLE